MRTLFLLSLLLCTTATAAPVPKELKKQGSIVGEWKLESVTVGGTASSVGPDDTDWKIDENFALTRSNSTKSRPWGNQLKIDTATKELDWPSGIVTFLGRYEVSGDQLTICLGLKNLPRPTNCEPNAGNFVWVLRRAQK